MKSLEVFPGSSILVKGKIQPSSILLIGPTGSGKTVFCKHFFFNGLLIGEPCVYVTTSETPKEIESSMKNFGMNIESFKEKNLVRIVDGCSWKSGKKTSSEYAVDAQQNYLTAISIKIKKAQQGLTKPRFVFDSVSEMTALSDPDSVLNFLQVLTTRIRLEGGKAIFVVAAGAHDEHFLNLLRLTFDGILEMRLDETNEELKRLLRVFSLKGVRHKTNWIPFEITDKGIVLHSESKLRCSLCSKPIEWEPIYETFGGKKIPFDSQECIDTYKKFKSVYGSSFE
jgi:non-specific serine/threonine protein kinase